MPLANTSKGRGSACKDCCPGPRFQDPSGCGSLLGTVILASGARYEIECFGFDVSTHSQEAGPETSPVWCAIVWHLFLDHSHRNCSRKWHPFGCQNPEPESGPESGTNLGARIRNQNLVRKVAPISVPESGTRTWPGKWHQFRCQNPDPILGPCCYLFGIESFTEF